MTAFNMKNEKSEGKFLADGSYREHKKEDIKDPWLREVVEKQLLYKPKKQEKVVESAIPNISRGEALVSVTRALVGCYMCATAGQWHTRALSLVGCYKIATSQASGKLSY